MPTCFVIQPFDGGKYDKRFEDVYVPAIEAAGLTPYRVDRDAGVEMPIDSIEQGIRNAAVCLADITADNPNVWYELGYAYAGRRPIVMVCSNERTKYPFDIQHRTVISYTSESSRDFATLQSKITDRIKALLSKGEALRQLEENEQVAPVAGLGQAELFVLAALAGNTFPTESTTSLRYLKGEVERAGLTAIGFALGIRRLQEKSLIETLSETDRDGDPMDVARVTSIGWSWIDKNEEKFLIRREKHDGGFDDDIPF
jgi:hypothetical protein